MEKHSDLSQDKCTKQLFNSWADYPERPQSYKINEKYVAIPKTENGKEMHEQWVQPIEPLQARKVDDSFLAQNIQENCQNFIEDVKDARMTKVNANKYLNNGTRDGFSLSKTARKNHQNHNVEDVHNHNKQTETDSNRHLNSREKDVGLLVQNVAKNHQNIVDKNRGNHVRSTERNGEKFQENCEWEQLRKYVESYIEVHVKKFALFSLMFFGSVQIYSFSSLNQT